MSFAVVTLCRVVLEAYKSWDCTIFSAFRIEAPFWVGNTWIRKSELEKMALHGGGGRGRCLEGNLFGFFTESIFQVFCAGARSNGAFEFGGLGAQVIGFMTCPPIFFTSCAVVWRVVDRGLV